MRSFRTHPTRGLLLGILLGCGGRSQAAVHSPTTDSATSIAPAPALTAPPAIVEVRMTGNGSTQAAYAPNTLTIKSGTTVRFINRSGGPHNVTFYADSIPPGAAAVLRAAMPTPMADLTGPLLTTPNQTYDVSFAGAPAGTYKAYCLPHVALGMKITIHVE
jgi:plastocyanin